MPLATAPVILLILIIMQTLNLCVITWLLSPTSWFAFILFLIFVGGLIILFIYITSLASNEIFISRIIKINPYRYLFLLWMGAQFLLMGSHLPLPLPSLSQTTPLFESAVSPLTLVVIIYLLVTLVVAVKISRKLEGPIRNAMKIK